jgi:putative transposase
MPRTARAVEDGGYYHVLNRGNGRMDLFHKPADFAAFVRILNEAKERYPVEVMAWCLMSNHWHLVLRPRKAEALGRFMGWVGVTHVRRHHEHYHTVGGGHLYQGRFKSFPIQDDEHFLTVCRYAEANPLRAKMVEAAEDWPWSSCGQRGLPQPLLVTADWPVDRPRHWPALVNRPQRGSEVAAVQRSIARGTPFGQDEWVARAVKRLGLEFTLRGRGRPRGSKKE